MYFLGSPKELLSIGIYRIVSPSGSSYVGMTTKSFDERKTGHIRTLKNGNHRCSGLKRAHAKYDLANMTFEILEILDGESEELILEREQFWWDLLYSRGINLYNGRTSGAGSVIHTSETKKKISESLKKRNPASHVTASCPICHNEFRRLAKRYKEGSCCSTSCARIFSTTKKRGDLDSKVLALRKEGLSTWKIAEELGTYQQQVCRILNNKHL